MFLYITVSLSACVCASAWCVCVFVCVCVCVCVHLHGVSVCLCVCVFLALETNRSHFKSKLLVALPKVRHLDVQQREMLHLWCVDLQDGPVKALTILQGATQRRDTRQKAECEQRILLWLFSLVNDLYCSQPPGGEVEVLASLSVEPSCLNSLWQNQCVCVCVCVCVCELTEQPSTKALM